mmetsp:Transcript_174677/g.560198  ORF Transcript_174677/g.560198 Transcript_174677/m.560198 type:complete len:115 (+) Transcript_174677:1904-2248(+)
MAGFSTSAPATHAPFAGCIAFECMEIQVSLPWGVTDGTLRCRGLLRARCRRWTEQLLGGGQSHAARTLSEIVGWSYVALCGASEHGVFLVGPPTIEERGELIENQPCFLFFVDT